MLTGKYLGLAAALLMSVQLRAADLDQEVTFSIPAQPLESALLRFSQQAGVQVLTSSSELLEKSAPAISGRLRVRAALINLLEGTGLSFSRINDGTVAIHGVGAALKEQEPKTPKEMLLAQSQPEQISSADTPESDQAGDTALDEIVVTAQKRVENLQDVPIAISVLGGEQLDKSVGRGLNDELVRVPGVAIIEGAQTGGSQITIRGVGAPNNILFGSSPVAFYIDSVPFGFVKTAVTPNIAPYDLERVEVVRGPQGTLYGASAQNGVVRVLTKDADLNEPEFKIRTEISNTQHGGENYRGDAALNLPIVQDKLAARAVIGYQNESGWIDTTRTKDANDAEISNARLKFNAQATENLALGFSAWFSRSSFGGPNVGTDDRFSRTTAEEPIDVDYDTLSFNVGYDFTSFSLTSATSYINYSIDSRRESPVPQPVYPLPWPGNNVLTTNLDAWVLAEEINLSSTREGSWRWSLGTMYRKATETLFQARRNPATGGFAGAYQAPTHAEDSSESYAVFGELTRLFWDGRLELTGGVRYFEDEVTLQEKSRLTFAGGIPPNGLVHSTQDLSATSPRLVLTWHPTGALTTYASYSEGYRSGFTQASSVLAAAPQFPPAEPDNLTNYEVGAKGELLSGALSFDAAVYYMDWQDVQTPLIVTAFGLSLPATVNGTSASGAGLDLALTARPMKDLALSASYSVNDLTQDEAVIASGLLAFDKGERLSQSPKYTIGGAAEYAFALGAGGYRSRVSVSGNYVSVRRARLFAQESVTLIAEPLLLTRGAFSLESPKGWSATLYVDNATDEQDGVSAVDPLTPDWTPRVRPRTVGLQIDYRFDGQ